MSQTTTSQPAPAALQPSQSPSHHQERLAQFEQTVAALEAAVQSTTGVDLTASRIAALDLRARALVTAMTAGPKQGAAPPTGAGALVESAAAGLHPLVILEGPAARPSAAQAAAVPLPGAAVPTAAAPGAIPAATGAQAA